MTKKHYAAIAKVLAHLRRNSRYDTANFSVVRVKDVEEHLAELFGTDNPRFDRARFLKACAG